MQQRGSWSSNVGFVLAAAGSAIGLGNLWKFPYITYANDGGAFVLVYLVCILICGLPIMMAEILIGRRAQQSPVGAMRSVVGTRWAFVGALGVFSGFVLLSFYNVVAGWSLRSFAQCVGWTAKGFDSGFDGGADFTGMIANGGLQIGLSFAFMAVTVFVVAKGVQYGIERAARVLLPILLGILLLLLFNSFRMEGFGEAMRFIWVPDFGSIDMNGFLEALGHSFFTLSLGMGTMIAYGSYMSKDESVVRASGLVVLLDTLIALFATMIMFTVIFSQPGLREQIGRSTAGMLFITLPNVFYTGVPGGNLLAPLFYMLVAFAALTSTVSLLEVMVSFLVDEKQMSRPRAALVSGAAVFSLSILCGLSLGAVGGLSSFTVFGEKAGLFNTLDHLAANWLLPVGGLLVTLAAGWFLDQKVSREELERAAPAFFHYGLWRFFIRFVSPIAVGAILIAVIFFHADFT